MKSDFESMKFPRLHSLGIKSTQCIFHAVTKGKALKYADKVTFCPWENGQTSLSLS